MKEKWWLKIVMSKEDGEKLKALSDLKGVSVTELTKRILSNEIEKNEELIGEFLKLREKQN